MRQPCMPNQYHGSIFLEWYWEGKRGRMVSELNLVCLAHSGAHIRGLRLAHVPCVSPGTAAYSSNKLRVQRFHLLASKTLWEGGVKC